MSNYFKHPAETYVFINNIYIDDVYRIDFSMDESKMPIYGYRDRLYNYVTKGRSKVVGNIFINFSSPGYLYTALSNSDGERKTNPPAKNVHLNAYQKAEQELDSLNQELEQIFKQESSIEERRNNISKLMVKASRAGLSSQLASSLRYAFGYDKTRFADTINYEPTTHEKSFNIQIYYGHPEDDGRIIREITDCYLLGTNQVISAAGSPGGDMSSSAQVILEVYPFIGRQILTRN